MKKYTCPVLKETMHIGRDSVHNFYWHKLFLLLGLVLKPLRYQIKESYDLGVPYQPTEWWKYRNEWHELDIFVKTPDEKKIAIEVIVAETFGDIRSKVLKTKEALKVVRIVVFEPVQYLDRHFLFEAREKYMESLGHIPKTYKEMEEFAKRKWKEEDHLEVEFWSEDELARLLKGENVLIQRATVLRNKPVFSV